MCFYIDLQNRINVFFLKLVFLFDDSYLVDLSMVHIVEMFDDN